MRTPTGDKIKSKRLGLESLEHRRVLDSTVVFNELMYHPPDTPGLDSGAAEWIELYNQNAVDIDLTGWSIRGGVDFEFPVGTLLPGRSRLIVAADPALMRDRIGDAAPVLGPLNGRLSNGGELLELRSKTDRIMDSLEFGDNQPWPVAADGAGYSLAKGHEDKATGRAENWRSSLQLGGSPGLPNHALNANQVDTWLGTESSWKLQVPSAEITNQQWTDLDFDDSSWNDVGSAALGYDVNGFGRSDLVRHFDFEQIDQNGLSPDSVTDQVVADVVGATPTSVVAAPVGNGQSLQFDGVDDVATIDDVFDTSDYSYSIWVQPAAVRSQSVVLRTSASPLIFASHQLAMTDDGRFAVSASGGLSEAVTGTTVIEQDEWYHVVVTARENGELRLYVNGQLDAEPQPLGTINQTADEWQLGGPSNLGFGTPTLPNYAGRLDRFSVWNHALDFPQIEAISRGVAVDQVSGLADVIETDVAASLYGVSTGAWLRHSFQANAVYYDQLQMTVRYNDGFVAYLNGLPVVSRSAPNDPTWNSVATQPRDRASSLEFETIDLSSFADQIRAGDNVFSVHLLNSEAADANLLFDMSLDARVGRLDQLPRLQINEIPSAEADGFWVELRNNDTRPISLTGLSLGGTVVDGNEAPYALPSQSLAPGERYLVDAETIGLSADEDDMVLLFAPDNVTLFDAVRVLDRTRARRETGDFDWAYPSEATAGEANRFLISDAIVINELMYHDRPTYAEEVLGASATPRAIVPFAGSDWRYLESPDGLANDWAQQNHPDWVTGPAPLGFQAELLDELGTQLTLPFLLPEPVTTYYFETEFDFAGTQRGFDLSLTHQIDDGAIVYLNGVEVIRVNMPDRSDHTTLASSIVTIPVRSDAIPIPPELLQVGTNRLSVEVHQAESTFEEDVMMGLELLLLEHPSLDGPVEYEASSEEWIELYNRSDQPVDLSGWQLTDGIDYRFADGTVIAAHDYLVVSNDPQGLRDARGLLTHQVVGPFTRTLANGGERIALIDAAENVADEVEYYDGGRWPEYADGMGSSMELIDPFADNRSAEAWAASDEAPRSEWAHYEYVSEIFPIRYDPPIAFHELVVGLIDAGEILVDNIRVTREPDGEAAELIQNSSFEDDEVGGGASAWRLVGNHGESRVVVDPDNPQNKALHLIAESHMHYLSNHAETTLANRARVRSGEVYRISFDAKWLAGSPQFHTELFHKDAAKTTILHQPDNAGTPAAENSRRIDNAGPNHEQLHHAPAVPKENEPVDVSVRVTDFHGVDQVTLYYLVDEEPQYTAVPMVAVGDRYTGTIPGQSDRSTVQFYVESSDGLGGTSYFPAAGPDSRAVYRVLNQFELEEERHSVMLIMRPDDMDDLRARENMMDNDRYGATVIYDADEIYYDVGLRFKGSMFTRNSISTAGFSVRFSPDQKFRGIHRVITFDRKNEKEIQVRHLANAAGVYGMFDDVVGLLTPFGRRAEPTMMSMARYDNVFLESQFENGGDGTVYKLEGIRVMQTTVDGDPESLKIYQPIGWVQQYDIEDIGESKELYRWPILISNNRDRDNFDPILDLAQAFSLDGEALEERIGDVIDVDQWMRVFALMSVTGIADIYGQAEENPHNLSFYARPSDGKLVALPWDWDFAFQIATSAPLTGNGKNVHKVIRLPIYERQFYGHLLDIVDTVGNAEYFARWADHYGTMLRENYRGTSNYLTARGASIRSQIERDFAQIDFQVDETPETIDATTLDVTGQGWVDVREIRLAGTEQPLPLVWSATGNDADRWQTTLPLAPGLNEFTLQAVNYQGDVIGSHQFAVTSTVDSRPLVESLRVMELHYHPAPPRDGELAVDENEFEFIELMNVSDQSIDLEGAQFVQSPDGQGMRFAFEAQLLEPGERIVIVKNRAAFESRYGAAVRVALGSDPLTPDADSMLGEYGGRLDNGGETITLQDDRGVIIAQFAYQDETPWPTAADGEGPSLQRIDPANDPSLPVSWRAGNPNGTPGAGDVLPGDLNRDGRLDVADINRICAAIHDGETNAEFDVNQDQQINLADHQFLVEALMGVPIGDANLDGRFNSNDLVYVFQQGHYNDRVSNNSSWTTGDWNCDLEFDSADWVVALQRSRYES